MKRRTFLKTLAAAPALALPLSEARAQTSDKPAIVVLWLDGGYSSLFAEAGGCLASGVFGVTEQRVLDLGDGLLVDAETFGTLPEAITSRMCTVGVWHGYGDHDNGRRVWWYRRSDGTSYPIALARALGGSAAFRAVAFKAPYGYHRAQDGVSLSIVPDLSSALLASGVSAVSDPKVPSREPLGRGLEVALELSRRAFVRSPNMLREYYEGLQVAERALLSPPMPLDWTEIATAYGLGSSTAIDSLASKCAAAELMVRTGTDYVALHDPGEDALVGFGWDSHGDEDGESVRHMMQSRMSVLQTFLSRMLALQGHNVVVAVLGEFARSGGAGHASGLSSTVWGKRIRKGVAFPSTVNLVDYVLPSATPGVEAFYSFLCEAAGATSPFGDNPYRSMLL